MATLVVAVGIGLLAGVLSGLFGIGGGVMIVPASDTTPRGGFAVILVVASRRLVLVKT